MALAALATIPRCSLPVCLQCRVEPLQQVVLHAPEDAYVVQVLCAEGQLLEAGQPLLKLRATELTVELARARLQLAGTVLREREAQAVLRLATARAERRRREAQRQEVAQLARRATHLTVVSPMSGTCLTPRPQDLLGRTLTQGTPLVTVGNTSQLMASAVLASDATGDIRPGAPALFMPHPLPGLVLRGRVRDLIPVGREEARGSRLAARGPNGSFPANHDARGSPAEPVPSREPRAASREPERSDPGLPTTWFRLTVPITNPGALRPGMSGSLKVYGPARSLLGHLRQAVLRLLRADLWG